jgi:photosystem II stability/assembly factor-like uncharacterized protein
MKTFLFFCFLLFTGAANSQWVQQYSNLYHYYNTLFFVDSLNGWTGGYQYNGNSYILKTTSGGENWEEILVDHTPASIFFNNTDIGYIATNYGIYKSTDGGKNWKQNYSDSVHYNSIEFINDNTGWAVGEYLQDLYLLKTEDEGVNWSRSLIINDNMGDTQIDFVNVLTGFVTAWGSGKIWKTTDGGDNWFELYSDSLSGHSFFDISFSDELIGYAGGAGVDFISTTNGGNTWTKKDIPFTFCVDVKSDGSQIWVSGFDIGINAIIYSDNYGDTWTPLFTGNDQTIQDIFFLDNNNGWYCSTKGNSAPLYDGFIFKFEQDWIGNITSPLTPQQIYPADGSFIEVLPVDFEWEQTEYSTYRLQISNDSLFNKFFVFTHYTTGDTLFKGNSLYLQNNFQTVLYPDKKYYWRVRSENHVGVSDWSDTWSFTTSAPTNVEEENTPAKFKLFQNFPNPFNPVTRIMYSIKEKQFVTLKVYDLLGNEISTLVNEVKDHGSFEVEFKAMDLSSGIYFYKLKAGVLSETKKLILMK